MKRTYASIEDMRAQARRAIPRMIFDYVDGGARAEVTLRANRRAFDEVVFRPRMAVRINQPDLATTVLGQQVTLPLLLSPCGGLRAVHPDGEAGAARAAQQLGTIFTLSTAAGMTIEEVAAAAPGPRWFQLYFLGGRAGAEVLIDRADAAGYDALVVTIDTNVTGLRERDVRNGMTGGPYVNARNVLRFAPHVAVRPGWLRRFVRDGMEIKMANADHLNPDGSAMPQPQASAAMFAEAPTWDDIDWIRERWGKPLLIKGVLTADDSRRAVDAGADAVIISNHGGRQLDSAPATLDVLPEVVDAISHRGRSAARQRRAAW